MKLEECSEFLKRGLLNIFLLLKHAIDSQVSHYSLSLRGDLRHLGRLPGHDLPLAFALQERAGIAEVRRRRLAVFRVVHDEGKVAHALASVRMEGKIIRLKRGLRLVGRAHADVFDDIGLGDGHAGRAGVDHVIGKEVVKGLLFPLGDIGQKVADKLCDMLDGGCVFRAHRDGAMVRDGDLAALGQCACSDGRQESRYRKHSQATPFHEFHLLSVFRKFFGAIGVPRLARDVNNFTPRPLPGSGTLLPVRSPWRHPRTVVPLPGCISRASQSSSLPGSNLPLLSPPSIFSLMRTSFLPHVMKAATAAFTYPLFLSDPQRPAERFISCRLFLVVYFFSSTSTYSASITPSSFFWPAPSAGASACGPAPSAPGAPAGGWADLYMASASLWEACVSFSWAEFIALASEVSKAFLASAKADSTLAFSSPEILSPFSLNIFSTL